jgi:hypothetical protein
VLGRSAYSVALQVDRGCERAYGFIGTGGKTEFLDLNALMELNDGEEVRVLYHLVRDQVRTRGYLWY